MLNDLMNKSLFLQNLKQVQAVRLYLQISCILFAKLILNKFCIVMHLCCKPVQHNYTTVVIVYTQWLGVEEEEKPTCKKKRIRTRKSKVCCQSWI